MPIVLGFVIRVVIAAAISYAVMSGFAALEQRYRDRQDHDDEQAGV